MNPCLGYHPEINVIETFRSGIMEAVNDMMASTTPDADCALARGKHITDAYNSDYVEIRILTGLDSPLPMHLRVREDIHVPGLLLEIIRYPNETSYRAFCDYAEDRISDFSMTPDGDLRIPSENGGMRNIGPTHLYDPHFFYIQIPINTIEVESEDHHEAIALDLYLYLRNNRLTIRDILTKDDYDHILTATKLLGIMS